jgi:hypothetical protein
MYLVLSKALPLDGMWLTVREGGALDVGQIRGSDVSPLYPVEPPSFYVAVRLRQVDVPNPQSRSYHSTLKTLSGLVPDLDMSEAEPPADKTVPATAVEIITVIPQTQEPDEDMEAAKQRCFGFLVDFLRVCRSVQLLAGPPPTFERLPAFAVIQTRQVANGQRDSLMGLILPTADVVTPEMPPLTTRQFHGLLANFHKLIRRDPIFICQEYRAKADAAFLAGDYPDAVIAAAVASEVLLDHTLGLMLYEESVSVTDARVVWEGVGLATRLKNQYAGRLGGPWHREIEAWKEKVAELRGRILHAGYRPSAQEAESAVMSYDELNEFIRKRLIEKRTKYPWTTVSIAGLSKVRAEGKLSGKFKAFVADLDLNDPELERYLKWRDEVR